MSELDDTFVDLTQMIARPPPPTTPALLEDEISHPSAINGRAPYEGNLAFGMRPDVLGGIMDAAASGSSNEWFILAEQIEELFPHYLSVLSKRKRQVCQLPITVEDAGDSAEQKKHGDLIRNWIKTEVLQRSLFDILDAVGKGFSVCEMVWQTNTDHFWPIKILYRKTSWFEVSWIDGEQILLRDGPGFTQLAAHKFVVHKHPAKSGSLVKSGLTWMVAFLWMFATFNLRDWALFVQGYGLPMRLGKYGPEASESDKRVLWRAVSAIAGDVAAIIPKSMEVEFMKGGDRTGDTQLFEKRADWLNREVSKLVLGSTAGTEAIAGGHAVGKEHRQVEEDVERFDTGLLGVSVTQQIVTAIVNFTFGPPPDGQYPTVRIGRPDEVPLQIWLPGVTALAAAGMKFKVSEIHARLGTTEPEGDDEVFGGTPEPAEPGMEGKDVPPLAVTPSMNPIASQSQVRWLGQLIAAHSQMKPDLIALMTERLAEEASHALAGMTGRVRAEFEAATDMSDLAHRLGKLDLNPDEFAEAMTRGMALAELVGQAALVHQIHASR